MSSLCSIELQRKRLYYLIDDVKQYVEEDELWPLLKLNNKLYTHEEALRHGQDSERNAPRSAVQEGVWIAIT
jgi:hypothetical protein